ncbi:MAG TPA: hypothetical protein PJ982_04375, partial [Lacipirellulaceae bacterium]|nr:hypothetical protein [Lacipirellulaceae bacterium]
MKRILLFATAINCGLVGNSPVRATLVTHLTIAATGTAAPSGMGNYTSLGSPVIPQVNSSG